MANADDLKRNYERWARHHPGRRWPEVKAGFEAGFKHGLSWAKRPEPREGLPLPLPLVGKELTDLLGDRGG